MLNIGLEIVASAISGSKEGLIKPPICNFRNILVNMQFYELFLPSFLSLIRDFPD